MMMILRALAMPMAVILGLSGCRDSSGPTLSNAQLLQAMNGQLFEVKLPDDLQREDRGGLAKRFADGRIEPMDESMGWRPGAVIKVACFYPEKGKFRFMYFDDHTSMTGTGFGFPTEGIQSRSGPKRTGLSVGDGLMRFSPDGTMSEGEKLEGDDFDIIFHFERRK